MSIFFFFSGCSDADDRVVKQTWGKVVCQYSTSQWWLLYYFSCLYGKAPFPFSTPESALQENVEALSLGSGDSALPMLYCLKNNIAQVYERILFVAAAVDKQ